MRKYWILSGAGLNGFAYIGAFQEFEKQWGERWFLESEGWYGSSMGALLATLLTIGFSIEELIHLVREFPWDTLVDPSWDSIWHHCYLDDGKRYRKLIKSCLLQKNVSTDITLREVEERYQRKIGITVSNLTFGIVETLNGREYPNIKLIDALTITTAVPFLFPPTMIDLNGSGPCLYTDGAFFRPYPFHHVSKDDQRNSIGFYNANPINPSIQTYLPNNVFEYMSMIFRSSRMFLVRQLWTDTLADRTISFDFSPKDELDFDMTMEEREGLIEKGRQKAKEWLSRKNSIMELDSIDKDLQ